MPAFEKYRSLDGNSMPINAAVEFHICREELSTDVSRCHNRGTGLVLINAQSLTRDVKII
jgi:hypothetical protein